MPSVFLPWESSSCFHMVLEAGSLAVNMMALEDHLLVASACQQNSLLALRSLPSAVETCLIVLAAVDPSSVSPVSGAAGKLSIPIPPYTSRDLPLTWKWQFWKVFLLHLLTWTYRTSLFQQMWSWKVICFCFLTLFGYALHLCGRGVLEGTFPHLALLSKIMACKTLNWSFSDISVFGRKWWSWKDCIYGEFL